MGLSTLILFRSEFQFLKHAFVTFRILSREREKDVKPIRKWQAHALHIKGLAVSHGQDIRVATCGSDHIATIYSISLDISLLKVRSCSNLYFYCYRFLQIGH